MKGGSDYSKRVRKLFNKLKRESPVPPPPEAERLVEHLIVGILSEDATDGKAKAALRQIKESTVDLNDFRVTPAGDIVEIIGKSYPDAVRKASQLSRSLNAIFEKEHGLDLTFLQEKTKREAHEYLESVTTPFAAAWTLLWGLSGHAIPVDQQMMAVLRRDKLVDLQASAAEIQSFLERNIAASDAGAFVLLMRKYVGTKAPRGKPGTDKNEVAGKAGPDDGRRKRPETAEGKAPSHS
jgi:endonuclease III